MIIDANVVWAFAAGLILGIHWDDDRDTIRKMLVNSSPEIVEEVLTNVGNKVAGKYVSRYEWKQYAFGMLRNIRNER